MKVICSRGNLGNQVFYSAFADYMRRVNPKEKVYCFHVPGCPKVTVDKFFQVKTPCQSLLVDFISFFVFYTDLIIRKKIYKKGLPGFIICGENEPINYNSTFYSHYLQSKEFFQDFDSSWLQVRMPNEMSEAYLYYERLIKETASICIHVRRGDFISQTSAFRDLSASDYYERAIEKALKLNPNSTLFFFSDDLEYVKKRFKYENSFFVDCNRGSYSYLDIKLMSLAKVNIIANSTFSYWGAYMGHENKTIIAPAQWYKPESGRETPNILFDEWILI